jgi:hypothetical protein
MARGADGCQPSFFDFKVLRYVLFYLLHVRSRCTGFRSKTPSYAQKSLCTLRIFKLQSKHSNLRSETILFTLSQHEKGLQIADQRKKLTQQRLPTSIKSVLSLFRLIWFRINGHQRHLSLERCIRGRLAFHQVLLRKYQRLGARPGSLLHLLEQPLST